RSPSSRRTSGRAGRDREPSARGAPAAASALRRPRRARLRRAPAAAACAATAGRGPHAVCSASASGACPINVRRDPRDAADAMNASVEIVSIAIVGGGSAGLATAALLREQGLEAVVLEAGPEPGAAWRALRPAAAAHAAPSLGPPRPPD